MKQFIVTATCTVKKEFVVEAHSEQEARNKFEQMNVIDEREVGMSDWVLDSIARDE